MRRLNPRVVAALSIFAAAFGSITCAEHPAGPKTALRALVGLAPALSKSAEQVYRNLVSFQLEVNNVRVVLLRENNEVALDTSVTVAPGDTVVVLQLSVPLAGGTQETFEAAIELRDGTQVLFSGTQSVIARLGPGGSPASTPIQLEYSGPGSTVTTLDIVPDTTIVAPDSLVMRPVARDQNNQPVTNLNLTWSVDDAARATVDGAGVLKPVGPRGTVVVTATLPTSVSGSATVNIQSRPTTVIVVSGGAQTATVGAALSQPIVIEVRAADNLPVAGHTVAFAVASGGGSVTPPNATTDANGRASATLTLGVTAGTQSISVTPSGIAAITVNATATAGNATGIVAGANQTVSDTAGATLGSGNVPSVTVRDAHSNGVSGVQVKFRRHGGTGATINAQSDTIVLVTSDATGVAALTGRRLQTTAGFDTVLATATGLSDTLRFAATVSHATATQLAFGTQPVDGTAGAPMPTFTVEVRDQFGNRVTSGGGSTPTVALSMTGATLSGTTTVAAVAGVATFSNVTVSPAGSPYTLSAASGVLTAASSNAFAMTSAGPTTRTWTAATNGAWETAANWSGGAVPGAQDTAVITAAGTYAVTISSAVSVAKIVVGGASGSQVLHVTGGTGTLTVSDSIRVATSGGLLLGLTGGGTVLTGGKVLVQGSMQWHGGTISGTGSLNVASGGAFMIPGTAPVTLSGRALQNFGTVVFSGTGGLALADGASIENSSEFLTQGSGSITQGTGSAGSFLNFSSFHKLVGDAGTTAIGVAFTNSGTVEIQTGTLAFSGPSLTNTGAATIKGTGTLDVSGVTTVTNAGTIAPGLSPGALGVTGNLPMQGTSTIAMELMGTTAGLQHDQLNISGSATLGGTLAITLPGYTPNEGDVFTIMTFGSRTGTFASVTGATLSFGRHLEVIYSATDVKLMVVSDIPVPTISWTNATGGNWNLASNWNLNRVPNSSDIVGINAAGTYTVTMDVNPTIAGLVVGGATGTQVLTGTGRTLTTNGTSYVALGDEFTMISGTLAGSGTFFNAGQTTLRSTSVASTVSLSNLDLLLLEGTTAIHGALIADTFESWIQVRGNSAAGSANVTIDNGFTNGGEIDLTNSSTGGWGATLSVLAGTIINTEDGIILSETGTSGGARTLTAAIDNRGSLEVVQALTINKVDATHTNSGFIDVLSADLTITQSGANPSFMNTASGSLFLDNSRTLTISGGIVNLGSGDVSGSNSSCLAITNAQLTLGPSVVTSPLTLTSTTVNGGTLTLGSGEVLTLRNGTLSAAVTIGSGALLRGWGTLALSGAVAVNGGGTLRVDGNSNAGSAVVTVANGFTNNGTIELTNTTTGGWGALFNVTNGTLVNVGTISSLSGTSGGSRALGAELNNQGTLNVATALTINRANSNHVNNSTITLSTANLVITQSSNGSFVNNGTITMSGASRTLNISGGLVDVNQGSLTGPLGTSLVLTGAATVDLLTSTMTAPLTLTSATVNGTVTIPNSENLLLMDGIMTAPIVIQSGGTLLGFGTVTLQGAITLNAGGLFRVVGNSVGGSAAVTVLNGFTNNGTIELTNTSTGGWGSRLNVTTGTLTNAGQIISMVGVSGGSRVLGAQLNNQSSLEIDQALTIDRAGSAHQNNSTINLDLANLTITQTGTTPSFTNNGTIGISGAGRTVTVSGGHLDVNQGSIVGALGTALVVNGGATVDLGVPNVQVPLTLTSATVTSAQTIATGETLILLDGALSSALTIQNGGTLRGMGTLALNGALTIDAGGLLIPEGNSTGGTSFVTVANGFTNSGTIRLTNTTTGGWGSRIIVTTGSLTNAGTISVLPGLSSGSRQISAQLINNGTLDIDLALTIDSPGADHVNNATITLDAANLTVTQSGTTPTFTNNSTIAMSGAGRTLTVNGGHLDVNQGLISGTLGNGTLIVNGGATVDILPTTVTCPITLTSATVNNAISLISGQTMTLLDGALNAAITVGAGGTLLGMGTLALNGTLTLSSGGVLRADGNSTGGSAVVTVVNGFTNDGTIELTNTTTGGWGSRLNVTNGTLLNAGTISSLVGTSGGSRILGAQLNNGANGFLTINQALELNRASSAHVNNNAITLNAANLTVTQTGTSPSFTNNSTIAMSGTGRTMTVSGGLLDVNQGSITGTLGAGTLIVTGGATVDLGVANVQAPLTLTSATVSSAITIADGQTLTLLDGALNAAVTVNGGGTGGTLRTVGTVALNGAVSTQTNTVGGRLLVDGNSTGGSAVVTVASGFTNAGRIELTNSTTGGWGATLNVTSGTLTNTGSIQSLPGTSGGTRAIGGNVSNGGQIRPGGTGVAVATLTINGNYTQTSGGGLYIDMASNTSSDRLAVSGTATLAGTVFIAAIAPYSLQSGPQWTAMTFASGTGSVAVSGPCASFHTLNATNLLVSMSC